MGAVMLVLAVMTETESSSSRDLKPKSTINTGLSTGMTQGIWTDGISTDESSWLNGLDLYSNAIPLAVTEVRKHFGSKSTGVNVSIAPVTNVTASDKQKITTVPLARTAITVLRNPPSSPAAATATTTILPPSTTSRPHKGSDAPFLTEVEPGLWRLNFSLCSNMTDVAHQSFQFGDTVEALFELHPDDKRSYVCRFLTSRKRNYVYMTIVMEEFRVWGDDGGSPCIADFASFTYDDQNRPVGTRYPCEESIVIATSPIPGIVEQNHVGLIMTVNAGDRLKRTIRERSTLKIFWKFRFFFTDRPGYTIAEHYHTTSQHAGFITNFLFNGRRHYSTFTNVFFMFRISAWEVVMISFLHFDIDCTEGKLQYYERTSEKMQGEDEMMFDASLLHRLRGVFVLIDTRCGTEPLPPTLYNVTIGIRFYSGTGKTASGFKLHYSIHNATEAPQSLGANLFNCSVPYYPSFQQHLQCNLVVQCQGGEDEIDCPYTTADCGLGLVDAGDKCYKYVEERRRDHVV
ncbi:hypothetical protein BaRGS_00011721 [Batillaria attramentaria]|uniref:CUB domain-containing protein n=1 Tax=Batillaria attramentaria TaxID=370345 RepID=A0ABD0LC76_9CAEN